MKDDLTTAVEYYQNLLLDQYVDQPKAYATIGLLAKAALCDLVQMNFNSAFNINLGVGAQLDILGQYVGRNRLYIGESDEEYRQVLKLCVVKNYSDSSLSSINSLLSGFFGNQIICFDQLNMTMSYWVTSALGNLSSLAVTYDLLPRPMGVAISAIFNAGTTTKIFAFQSYNTSTGYTTGFSSYATGFNNYAFMNYSFQVGAVT